MLIGLKSNGLKFSGATKLGFLEVETDEPRLQEEMVKNLILTVLKNDYNDVRAGCSGLPLVV
jgi:hypothetical protein